MPRGRFLVLERRDIRAAVEVAIWMVSCTFAINGVLLASQSLVFAGICAAATTGVIGLAVLYRLGARRRPHLVAFAVYVVIMGLGVPAVVTTPAMAPMLAGEFAVVVVSVAAFTPWSYRWHAAFLSMSTMALVTGALTSNVTDAQRVGPCLVGISALIASILGNRFTRTRRLRAWEQENRLRRQTAELRRTVARLDAANVTIERLEGILPICARCKRIRVDEDWEPIEGYVSSRSAAQFSHGICPECSVLLYGFVTD